MQSAPNVGRHLIIKVCSIIAFSCLLRESEIYNLTWDKVLVNGSNIEVKVMRNKRTGNMEETSYFITDYLLINIIKIYVEIFTDTV
jgi:hypothetical protein